MTARWVAPPAVVPGRERPRLVHLTTTDMSLDWLLRPQLEAFADAGYEVIGIAAPAGHAGALAASGVEVVALPEATRSVDLRRDLGAFGSLVGHLRRLRPDILHTHNPKPGVYGRLAGRVAGVPVVVNTQHGLFATAEDRPTKRAVVYVAERLAAACSQAELVQNPDDLATLRRLRVPDERLTLLGNGVDLAHFTADSVDSGTRARVRAELGVADDEVLVGAVGRLVWEKGLAEVFAAAVSLRAIRPQVRVVVVGPSDDEKADGLQPSDVARATADGGVSFLGRRTDVADLYAAMDVYVLASHREGFPRSAMEAVAMGLPIVTTDARGCREVVVHERTGLRVPVGDAVALTDAIALLADDPARRHAMGRAGVDLARERFDQQVVIDRTLATYDRLLRRAARSST